MDAHAASLPPPVGGWDTLNSLADMPPQNAVELINWFPQPDRVVTRPGYVRHATGLPGVVETVMVHQAPSGAAQMFGACGTEIYDVTAAGEVGAAALTGLENARWQWTQMGTPGGHFLWCCNGAVAPRTFDGTSWGTPTLTGSGLSASSVVWVNAHQRRLWFGEAGTLRAWYLAPNAISGTATMFDFSGLTGLGGSLVGMGTWTRDGGSGADDVAVFLTSEGEALVYAGTDPASDWALQGVFRIGRPLGRRAMTRAGADLLIMTEDGFVALSTVLPVDRSQQSSAAISRQINSAVTAHARIYGTNFGWQAFFYPAANMLLFNAPAQAAGFEQFVFNTVTRAPCRFTGVPARCWALLGEVPFFGANGMVCRYDAAVTDDGADVRALAVQAPTAFGMRARNKAMKRVRVTTQSEVPPALGVDVLMDYAVGEVLPPVTMDGATPMALWDDALWDDALWAGLATWASWRGARGRGRVASLRVQGVARESAITWVATDVLYVPGGVL